MIRILVVDDEELLRKGIIARLEDMHCPDMAIDSAEDGRQAWESIRRDPPDLVLADVRMPGIDGLQLISMARNEKLDTRFVVISGHAEFRYAQEALANKAFAYILKPISDREFAGTILRAIDEIRDGRRERAGLDEQQVSRWMNAVLHGRHPPGAETDGDRFAALEAAIGNQYSMLALVEGDLVWPGRYHQLIRDALLTEDCGCLRMIFRDNQSFIRYGILLSHQNANSLGVNARQYLRRLFESLGRRLPAPAIIAASEPLQSLTPELYRQAISARELRFQQTPPALCEFRNMPTGPTPPLPHEAMRLLTSYLERRDMLSIERIITDLFSVRGLSGVSSAYPRLLWNAVVNHLSDFLSTNPGNSSLRPITEILGVKAFDQCQDNDALVLCLNSAISLAISPEAAANPTSGNRIRLACQFIKQHYNEDLTVNGLADRYAMNPSYFSTVFKRETGQTVISALTEARIGHACRLLSGTDSSIVDIALTIGYQDPQYFFRVFKKVIGQTPMEYRRGNNPPE